MSSKYILGTRARNSFLKLFLMMMVLCGSVMIHAQETPTNLQGAVQNIKIGGNVYGGGNAGNTGGSATVTVRMGDIDGNVFGGARMANVAGSTFVNIDGEDAPDNTFILINRVYGGNEIAGTIGTSTNLPTKDDGTTPALTEATYYILLSLYRPRHGYGIMQQTEELSGGRVRLAAGTLYGALNTLCDKGWIMLKTVDDDNRRKEYLLTDKGRDVLIHEVKRLKELAHNGEMILGEDL